MKTQFARKGDVDRKWYVVNADGLVLGRMAVKIAMHLRGKTKAQFTPHADAGDFVVVVNASKIKVTGKKLEDKVYYSHTGYPGGLKSATLKERMEKHPEKVIMDAVRGMLPKSRLGRAMLKKLKVYGGAEHPHEAQQPVAMA
jgi:large subunit ribosomal protein L13